MPSTLPPNTPPEIVSLIGQIGSLSISIDCPPVTEILKLAGDWRTTASQEHRDALDAIDIDFRRRVYWGIIVPILKAMGLPDPPPIPSSTVQALVTK